MYVACDRYNGDFQTQAPVLNTWNIYVVIKLVLLLVLKKDGDFQHESF